MSEVSLIDKYKEMLQINEEVVLKKDLRQIANIHNITKRTLLKILAEKGYEYDRKAKGYICIKSATKSLEMPGTTLEDLVEKFMLMQLEFNNKMLKESHKNDEMSHCGKLSHEGEIIDIEVNPVPQEGWNYNKRSIKVDDEVWESYIKVCENKFPGLKRQEITTIMFDKFIRENQ